MSRSKQLVGLVTCVASVSAFTLAYAAAGPVASASAKPHAAAIGGKVAVNSQAIIDYWTPQRLASAKDVDVLVASAPVTSALHDVTTGKAGAVAGGLPSGAAASATAPAPTPITEAFSYPFPYTSFNVPTSNYKKYPWAVNGKVFFTNSGGNFVCSATVVPSVNGSSNENEIWTAGHCLVNTEVNNQTLDSFFEFIPAYNGSAKKLAAQEPFGVFTWNGAWETTSAWYFNRDLSEDEAALQMNANGSGQILGNRTGWAGFAWNQSTDQQFVAFGYPAAAPYNGNLMVTDIGASAVLDTGIGGAGSAPIGIGNPMTGGSSGGGWFIGWSETGTGWVNGHNDYKYNTQPGAMYSPYQDTLSNTVRCFGAASC
jgi:V8-like Glu-specific endopeptidase